MVTLIIAMQKEPQLRVNSHCDSFSICRAFAKRLVSSHLLCELFVEYPYFTRDSHTYQLSVPNSLFWYYVTFEFILVL